MKVTYKLIRITTVPLSLQKLISGQMQFMGRQGFEVTMISSDFQGKEELKETEQSNFLPVNMTRVISPFADLRSLYQLIRVFKMLRPDIVHTHTPKAGLLGMMAAWICGVPVRLHTVAGLPLMEARGLKRIILNLVERTTYACASKVYPNSRNLKQFIENEDFCASEKLKVIGNGSSNGIDTERFKRGVEIDRSAVDLKSKLGIRDDDFTFVFVGRLVKDKGIEELVGAFSILNKKYRNLKLLLVGPEERELDPLSESCIAQIYQNPFISTVGYQSDVRPYLSLSSALVFPSYREGFPNVPMQAGCFDLPSVVTDINGCNEIIVEEENGLIIPVKDQTALYDAMERLYLDAELYAKMKSNARRMIVERYEQETVWQLILEEYNQHLKNMNIV